MKMVGYASLTHPTDHELLRVARNGKLHVCLRQANPTGKSRKTLSIPAAKNIPLAPSRLGKNSAFSGVGVDSAYDESHIQDRR
jgi:hypothetical protein